MNKVLTITSLSLALVSAAFADTDVLFLPNTVVPNACVAGFTGVYSGGAELVPVYKDISTYCNPGYYLPANSEVCVKCLINSYCVGGTYDFNTTKDQGIVGCPNNLLAPRGMWESGQCGRVLHIGNKYVYLRSTKKTTPSLNFDMDQDGTPDFFGSMSLISVPMNSDFSELPEHNKLVIEIQDDYVLPDQSVIPHGKYYVHDDTVTPDDD